MGTFTDLKKAFLKLHEQVHPEDKGIGNVQFAYQDWELFSRLFRIDFFEPEDDPEWQEYQQSE